MTPGLLELSFRVASPILNRYGNSTCCSFSLSPQSSVFYVLHLVIHHYAAIFFANLTHLGRGNPNWRIASIRLADGVFLLIDIGGPNPL